MEFVICEKHKKVEKTCGKASSNGYVCMNRYCPDSFKVFCSNCKNDHRDHAIKVLSIEDTTFLLERLQKLPAKDSTRYVGEALDIMKKLKLIKEFKKKIDILEKEIQKQALKLIDNTETLVQEYNACVEGVETLSDVLGSIEKPDNYRHFFDNSQKLLSNLDYNFKKDKLQYGNALTKEKEDKRRKTIEGAKRKIEEVRDYSMKIIEVILHNSESDDEEQDVNYQKKHYEMLRNQLALDKDENELEEEIFSLKNSNSTSNKSRIRRPHCSDGESQTSETLSLKQFTVEYEQKLNQMKTSHQQAENDLKAKLKAVSSQKEGLSKQLTSCKQKYEDKRKNIKDLEVSLRDNRLQRVKKQKSREEVVGKIIDLWQWKGLNDKQD